MRRSRVHWAAAVVAPWCIGLAALLSIVPEAGQTAPMGGTFLPLSIRAPAMPSDLVPLHTLALMSDLSVAESNRLRAVPASYAVGSAADLGRVADETEPRTDLKSGATPLPSIDRAKKGDPSIGLRPTFDTRLRQQGGLGRLRASQLLSPHDDALPAGSFSLSDNGGPLDGATSFSPWGDDEKPEDSAVSQRRNGTVIAMQPAAFRERLLQGATPKVSRAEALASATPAPADGAPVLASFAVPLPAGPNLSIPTGSPRPNFAALLVGERGARERKCLAEAVYFEARSEPEEGQAAVAQVVLNRATSGLYPPSVCGVVYQNRTHHKACQFSFACEGKALRVTETEAWHTAERIADEVVQGKTYLSDVGGATHYHAKYVRPAWARRLVKMDVIGHHIFYKLKAGQT